MFTRSTTAVRDLSARASLQPDLSRAVRATVAFMVPLCLALGGWTRLDMAGIAIAAQNIAMVDVRGDYRLRLGLFLTMAAVYVGTISLGTAVGNNLAAAIAATVLIAAAGGLWRHLSNDYGPALAISSTFLFLYALGAAGNRGTIGQHAASALIGGIWGTIIQVANWPFRPQHALRRVVADSWIAVADLFAALTPDPALDPQERHDKIQAAEATLRSTLDAAYSILERTPHGPLRQQLETLNLAAARLATRVVALNTALESSMAESGFGSLAPSFDPPLVSLTNLSRGAAVTVVSRQPAQLATFEVRLRRVTSLLRALRARVVSAAPGDANHSQLAEIVRQIESHLPAVHDSVRATVERAAEPGAFSLELLDLRELALRPLASALNLNTHVDPALIRYTARLALLMVIGVIAFKLVALPHGYWLPFTVVVVLQPDYGATRDRASQRVLGTIAGGIMASGLLWLHLPLAVLMAATAATIFAFGYWVKRNYALAIFFITLFIVVVTEANGPVTINLAIERLVSTVIGGALALLAAQLFWPVWERQRLPAMLAAAFTANREYLQLLVTRLGSGGNFDGEARKAKRKAETANAAAFSSLRRMSGEPASFQLGLELGATLANGNNRLTRALNVLSIHLGETTPITDPALGRFAALASETLDLLAQRIAATAANPAQLERLLTQLEALALPTENKPERERWVFAQLTRAATELTALALAMQESAADDTTRAVSDTRFPI